MDLYFLEFYDCIAAVLKYPAISVIDKAGWLSVLLTEYRMFQQIER